MTTQDIRPSPIAGTWYEGNPLRLANTVDAFLDAANLPPLAGEVIGLMTPHAGHRYSGAVAGRAFAAVRGRSVDLVAILAPMHHPYAAPLLTSAHAAYATPLGSLPVNHAAAEALHAALIQRLPFGLTAVRNDPEHALEIELPFLQRALTGEFQILPVMLRAQDTRTARALGEALAETLRDVSALLVASTDLSHYHPQEEARRLDAVIMEAVAAFSPQQLYQGGGEACGVGALAAVMWAAKALGANRAQTLGYATSGDITGDYQAVVGYGAAAFLAA